MNPDEKPSEFQITSQPGEKITVEGSILQLRFADGKGSDTQISAWELAQSIEGVAGIAEELGKMGFFGEGMSPELQVRPPKEGSFVLDFVVPITDMAHNDPGGTAALFGTLGTGFAYAIHNGVKLVKGDRVKDIEPVEGNEEIFKVTWQSGEVTHTPVDVWQKFQRMPRKTRKNFQKLMAPLEDSADRLEIRSGTTSQSTEEIMNTPVVEEYDHRDYREVSYEPPAEEDVETIFDVEATFQSMNFEFGKKWKIISTAGSRMATMEDEDFQKLIDSGLKIGKDDLFNVTIKETISHNLGKARSSWAMTKIVRTRKGDGESLN